MASLMKSLAVRILVLLEISLFLTSAMATEFGRNHRYCGRVLTESLALICDGEYGGLLPPSHKRSGKA